MTAITATRQERLLFVDYLRAGAILYIVGFWHLWEYAPDAPHYQNSFTHTLTFMALGLFVFISGFLLGGARVPVNFAGVMSFYGKRLLRIYPLYGLALVVFVLCGLTDWATAAKSATGVVMFFGPSPATLWFVAMLIWFYLLAPVLIISARNACVFIGMCCALYLGMAMLAVALPQADKRLFIYFPAFAAGIAAGAQLWEPGRWRIYAGIAACVFAGLLASAGNFGLFTVPLEGAVAVTGPAFVFACCAHGAQSFAPNRTVALVSYAGFAMYLFHRPLLGWAKDLFMPQGFFPQWFYLTILCLPIVLLLSWGLQATYDKNSLARAGN